MEDSREDRAELIEKIKAFDSQCGDYADVKIDQNVNNSIKISKVTTRDFWLHLSNFIKSLKEFSNYEFVILDKVTFVSSQNKTPIHLINCSFHNNVVFDSTHNDISYKFEYCTFNKNFTCDDVKFSNKIRFHNVSFNGVCSFRNTTFDDLVDFYSSRFNTPLQFFLTDFHDVSIFSNVQFFKSVQFLHNKIGPKTQISFEQAVFYNGLDISRSNFWCNIQFWGIKFVGLDKIKKGQQIGIISKDSLYINDDIIVNSEIIKGLSSDSLQKIRETFRIIKNQLRDVGNIIDSLLYHELELITYSLELKTASPIIKNIRNLYTRIVLTSNRISNRHGLSWVRAFCFTGGIGFIFFCSMCIIEPAISITGKRSDLAISIQAFLGFLNITEWDYKPFGLEATPTIYCILFIGRIFIGYGYYQLISAFRIFGKT